MKRTNSPLYARRTFILSLLSLVAVAALVTFGVSARRASREAALRATNNKAASAQLKSVPQPGTPATPGNNADDKNPNVPNLATITATLTDNIPAATTVAPGGTINYTAVINNSPAEDALGVIYNANLHASTTLVAGSKNVSPLAFDDDYTAVGNTLLEVGNATTQTGPQKSVAGTVLGNGDTEFLGDTFTISAFDATSTGGGTVTMVTTGPDAGSFTYISAADFTGPNPDTFTYTLRDDGTDGIAGNADDLTGKGTVNITVANQVWYVDNNAAAGGDGRSTTPFDELLDVTGASGPDTAGDIIYVNTGVTSYTGGMTLLNTQTLHGEGTALSVGPDTLAAAGADPTITNVAGNGVTLASGNTLTGFTVANTSSYDIANTNTATVGTLNISNVVLNGSGNLFRADSGGALTVTFESATATSAVTSGILIAGGATGNFTVTGATAIDDATLDGIAISNSAANATFTGVVTILNDGANGDGVDLLTNSGSYNFNGGVNITASGAGAFGFRAQSSGTVSITDVGTTQITSSNGTALLINPTTLSATLDTLTSGGGSEGISLSGMSGSLTIGSVSINAQTGDGIDITNSAGSVTINGGSIGNTNDPVGIGVDISGGTGNVTISATINKTTAGDVVEISGRTGGTVDFNGNLTSSAAAGVDLTSNTGGTIRFDGGMTLSTGAAIAFNSTASTGGTVIVTDPSGPGSGNNNVLTTTTGTALNVANTTIGAENLNFQSISTNGGTNGIVLNTTGTSGGLVVTGNSSGFCGGQTSGTPPAITQAPAAADCTGGTIQNSTGAGILLTSTSNVSLTRIQVINGGNDGVFGTTVTGFVLSNSLFDNNGNAVGEAGLDFDNLHGTSSVTNSTIRLSHENNIEVRNTATSGGQATLAVTGCQISNASAKTQSDDGVLYQMITTANGSINVSNSVFTANRGDHLQGNQANSAILNTVFTNNTLIGGHSTALGQDIVVNATLLTGAANVTYDINGNRINGAILSAITVNLGVPSAATTTMSGRVRNNIIGTTGVIRSCSEQAHGIAVDAHGKGTHTVSVTGNNMRQCKDRGINVTANDSPSISNGEIQPGGNLFLTVQSNTVLEGGPINPPGFPADGTGSREGFRLTGGSTATDTIFICLQLGGAGALANNFNRGTEAIATGLSDIRFSKQSTANLQIRLPGYAGGPTDGAAVSAFIAPQNTSSEDGSVTVDANISGSGGFVGGASCTLPAFMANPEEVSLRSGGGMDAFTGVVARVESSIAKAPDTAPLAKQVAMPVNNSAVAAAPAGNVDKTDARRSHHPQFKRSQRALASAVDDQPVGPLGGDPAVGPISIGTLPAGKSVTITYQAKVDVPPTAKQANHQGSVTFTGGPVGGVLTDDFDLPGGAADQTVTLFDVLSTWTGNANTNWNDPLNWTPNTYAPGVSNSGVNDVVIPNVGTQPNLVSPNVNIFSLTINSPMTLTVNNGQSLTINGGAAGSDLTFVGGGTITGGTLNFAGAGPHAINNASGLGSLSATNAMTVASPAVVTLNHNLQLGTLAVNGGTFNYANRTLTFTGAGLALSNSGTLSAGGDTVIFQGAAAQSASGTLGFNNLTVSNAAGVTFGSSFNVTGTLALSSGDITMTTPFILNQANTTPSTGSGDVIGTVRRSGGPFASATLLTFGNPNNQITFTGAGTKPSQIDVTMAKVGGYLASVSRNYTITPTGGTGFSSTLRLRYLDSELNNNTEAILNLRRFTGSTWKAVLPSVVDQTNNWVECNAVDTFSQWTFDDLDPTAADGTVTGRIVADDGTPVEGAVVRLSGTQNRKFITDANGFYRFEDVETNGFYNVTPSRVNYTFSPSVISFSQIGDTTNAAFGATATGGTANPLDTPEYFVRQHYLDFLGREPDEAGFNFWSDQILGCGDDFDCVDRKKQNVSAAYFLSIEFQETGGLVDRLYRTSYGVRPNFAEFKPDAAAIALGVRVGIEGWDTTLANNKAAFVEAFVQRPAFQTAYGSLANDAYVDALIANTGVNFSASERAALVNGLSGTMTRAGVLRAIVENPNVVAAKRNEAFVMMEYFGYLKREPDADGYQFWLNKLNQFNGNFEQAEMVRSFIVSGEYRQRFPR